jgi:hypothetical protein
MFENITNIIVSNESRDDDSLLVVRNNIQDLIRDADEND